MVDIPTYLRTYVCTCACLPPTRVEGTGIPGRSNKKRSTKKKCQNSIVIYSLEDLLARPPVSSLHETSPCMATVAAIDRES